MIAERGGARLKMDYDSDSIFPTNKTGRDAEIRNMGRQGKVVERIVDDTGVFVRVQYLDKQGLISKPIPVKQFGSRGTSAYWCPKIGDDVNVSMLPNSDQDGCVDGSFYNTGNPPPITNPDARHTTFADGTVMEYNEVDHTLKIVSGGPITITAGNVIVAAASITLTGLVAIVGDLTIEGDIEHIGDMNTSGVHTDSNGVHV